MQLLEIFSKSKSRLNCVHGSNSVWCVVHICSYVPGLIKRHPGWTDFFNVNYCLDYSQCSSTRVCICVTYYYCHSVGGGRIIIRVMGYMLYHTVRLHLCKCLVYRTALCRWHES